MDPVDPVALARRLIDIDSTTGQEADVAAVLASYLRERGYSVLEQPLEGGRCNVIAAGTVLTGSTPLYDLPGGKIIKAEPGEPLVVPEGAVVVPGARAVTVGPGRDWGLSLATPVIVKYRDDRTDTRTELEAWIR